jgi:hypothetical protein
MVSKYYDFGFFFRKYEPVQGYYANSYHRLYSIGYQFVYQIIIIGNAGLIHYVVMSSWENPGPGHREPVEMNLKYTDLCTSGTRGDMAVVQ